MFQLDCGEVVEADSEFLDEDVVIATIPDNNSNKTLIMAPVKAHFNETISKVEELPETFQMKSKLVSFLHSGS